MDKKLVDAISCHDNEPEKQFLNQPNIERPTIFGFQLNQSKLITSPEKLSSS